jgi:DNA-binding NtrC family response regulator
MAAILVIDPSTTIRETLRIVLGGEHAVSVASSWDVVAPGTSPELVIFGAPPGPRDDAGAAALRARLAPEAPLLLLNAADEIDPHALAPPGHRVEFMTKPFDAHLLRERVRALLTRPPRVVPPEATVSRHRRWVEPPLVTPAAAGLARRATLTDVPVLLVGERGTGTTEIARAIHFFAGGGTIVARAARELGTEPLLSAGEPRDAPAAVILEDVHLLSADAQRTLAAELRETSVTTTAVRLFATTDVDLEVRVSEGRFAAELAFALGVLPIVLTPLRSRLADLPALVDALLPPLVARARLERVTLATAALTRLQQYLWFGNVAELEAVLARTLAVHRPRVVEADMLLFDAAGAMRTAAADASAAGHSALTTTPLAGDASHAAASSDSGVPSGAAASSAGAAASSIGTGSSFGTGTSSDTSAPPARPPGAVTPGGVVSPATAPSTPPPRARVVALERRRADEAVPEAARAATSSRTVTSAPAAADGIGGNDDRIAAAGPGLEVLLGELAHELRNPMVTIKTFAQHLDSVLDDPEVRTRFAALTGEAITRMDALLETLLDFSRFRAPLPRAVDLAALLARALDEHAAELARKSARIEHTAATREPRTVEADEAQMLFAFRSLVDGLVRDLVAHTAVRIASRPDGAVELRVHADRAIAARLASWVAGAEQDADATPPLPFALAAALVRRNRGRLDVRPDDGETVITVTIAPRGGGQG